SGVARWGRVLQGEWVRRAGARRGGADVRQVDAVCADAQATLEAGTESKWNEMGNVNHAVWCMVAAIICFAAAAMYAQQVQDSAFSPAIAEPAYQTGRGPKVVIDAAHLNFHTEDGGYAPFAKLLRLDGYRVESNREPFTASSLGRVD